MTTEKCDGPAEQAFAILKSLVSPAYELRAPVVGVDLQGQAMVHTLLVEVLDHGGGKVFRHPCDAFDTEPVLDTQFTDSMRTAFRMALDEVNRDKPDTGRVWADGRCACPAGLAGGPGQR